MCSTESMNVYCYTKPDELKNAPFFQKIMTIPQITMSRGMSRTMGKTIRSLYGNVIDFTSFADALFDGWADRGSRFLYTTIISRYIRERILTDENHVERDWLFGCKKNISAAVNNILRLEEAGVSPEDFARIVNAKDRDLKLFLEFWKVLEERTDHIRKFRKIRREYMNPESFVKALEDRKDGAKQLLKFRGQKKIIFHGFQYFSPLQQYVFQCFRNAGFEILILIQADKKYPYANEIWRQMYTEEKGFAPYTQWIFQASDAQNPLGEIFEHGAFTPAPNLRLIKYKNTQEFMADIPRIANKENGYKLYCTDDRAANQMLRDYFPENYGVRNLLAYPIGQFVSTMHQMWDENLQCIALHADMLRNCFASGWIMVNGKSSINYTDDLEKILPYFEGCYVAEEWKNRLAILQDVYQEAVGAFAGEETGDAAMRRKKEIFGNPFRNFSPLSVCRERFESVTAVMGQLLEMAEKLFGENEPVSIYSHMAKLDGILDMKDGMAQELYREERMCIRQIFDVLESEKIKDFLCYPGDIAYSMQCLMRGDMDDTIQRQTDLDVLVFALYHIEAAPVFAKGRVHICLADVGKLPGAKGEFAWPLDESILTKLAEESNLIACWLNSSRSTILSNRNYIYSALKNKDVEISWIQQQGEKVLSPSPYITLLDKFTDAKTEAYDAQELNQETVDGLPGCKKIEKMDFSMKTNRELHSIDREMEYVICPMRYVYGYILGDSSAYRNTYQQNRAIMRLIQILTERMKPRYTMEQVAEQVFALFPAIRKAEKRQMLDDAMRYPMPPQETECTKFDRKEYTDRRLLLTFPDNKVFRAAEKKFSVCDSHCETKGIFFDKIGEEKEKNCELCPHSGYCRGAWFGQDYKMNGSDR